MPIRAMEVLQLWLTSSSMGNSNGTSRTEGAQNNSCHTASKTVSLKAPSLSYCTGGSYRSRIFLSSQFHLLFFFKVRGHWDGKQHCVLRNASVCADVGVLLQAVSLLAYYTSQQLIILSDSLESACKPKQSKKKPVSSGRIRNTLLIPIYFREFSNQSE